jgi:hypothetical protein
MTNDEVREHNREVFADIERMTAQLKARNDARAADRAKLYPERPLAKVLEFKPRSA